MSKLSLLSPIRFLCSLHRCRTEKNLALALQLHDACTTQNWFVQAHPSLGDHLISVLVQFGQITQARQVFDLLETRDQSSWDALIIGYVKHGESHQALSLYAKIKDDPSLHPNRYSFVALLKACGTLYELEVGKRLHAEIAELGLLERDIVVGSALVDMYIKVGFLEKAQEVFDELPAHDVVSWTLLIAGYVGHGHGKKAYECYERMQGYGVSPDTFTFVFILRACCSMPSKGSGVHAEIVKKGFERELVVGNTLIDMYAKCGLLQMALHVFENLSAQDVISWNALIAGLTEHGYGRRALSFFDHMQQKGFSSDAVTFVCSLKACCTIEDAAKGREIHIEIIQKGFETDVLVSSTLVNMYAKNGLLMDAHGVFDTLAVLNVVLCNALMSGYVEHGLGEEALGIFGRMEEESISRSAITFVFGLKACSSTGAASKGQEMHAEILRRGLERDLLIGSSVVDMYGKCGALAEARKAFDNLPIRDVVSWTALMVGYAEHGHDEEVLDCFERMQHDSVCSNAVACVCGLRACGNLGRAEVGLKLHADIARKGLESEPLVGNTLVEMYAKCHLLITAQLVFDKLDKLDKLQVQDPISLNALLSGYVEHGMVDMAMGCLDQVQSKGTHVNAITVVCSLRACSVAGMAAKLPWLHSEVLRRGLEEESVIVNTLIDTYAKCGLLTEAETLFKKSSARDVVSWTALISGYAQLGDTDAVFNLLDSMIQEGMSPNNVTCIGVLNACSHAGLVNEGCRFFEACGRQSGLAPTFEHYTCLVDMLGRAGRIDEAMAVILAMPLHPDSISWQKVLGACRKWGEVELGRQAYEHALCLDERGTAAYVCMSNIYADTNMLLDH